MNIQVAAAEEGSQGIISGHAKEKEE